MAAKKQFKGNERPLLLCGGSEADLIKRTGRWAKLVDKDWGDIMNRFTYYGMDSRNVLDPRVQQLCSVAALTAMGGTSHLHTHINWAFNAGATLPEVKEAIIQTTRYCGMPFINDAFEVLEKVVEERKKAKKKIPE